MLKPQSANLVKIENSNILTFLITNLPLLHLKRTELFLIQLEPYQHNAY